MAVQRELYTAAGPSYTSSQWLNIKSEKQDVSSPTPIPTLALLSSISVPGPSSALLGEQQGQNSKISFLFEPCGLLFPISLCETLRDVYLTDN